jgi:large subunit ribosomal protein L18
MAFSKEGRKKKIHLRIRKKIKGSGSKPRLSVYRSNKFIYAQLIDDTTGNTLTSASSLEKAVENKGNKIDQATHVGKLLAERAKSLNINNAVFDRGGYLYHGRVKALADGAREGGIKI